MSLLAPLFLLGAALIVGPILFHLIRRVPRQRVVFSSTELLPATPPTLLRRQRIQNPILLLLRCLIIALLCLAFARPFFNSPNFSPPAAAPRQALVIALDESASMGRANVWSQAIAKAKELVAKASPADTVSIIAFTDSVELLLSAEQWASWPLDQRQGFASEILDQRQPHPLPGYIDIGVAAAVRQIENLLDDQTSLNVAEIALVSDFAESSRLSGLAGLEWPPQVSLRRVPIPAASDNVGLRWLGWSDSPNPDTALARVALVRSEGQPATALTLAAHDPLAGSPLAPPLEIFLDNVSEQIALLELPSAARSAPLEIRLAGDQDPFDNTLSVAPVDLPQVAVHLLSQSPPSDPAAAPYFISKALAGIPSPLVSLDTSPLAATQFADAIIVDGKLDPASLATLRQRVENGAFALVLLHEPRQADDLADLSGAAPWTLDVSEKSDAMVGNIDFAHPAFTPFADPRYSDFTNLRFWKPMALQPPPGFTSETVARFDHRDPLLVEFPLGQGRVALWASAWSPDAGQWPLSSKFVPWLHQYISRALDRPAWPSNLVAQSSPLSQLQRAERWRDAAGLPLPAQPQQPGLSQAFVDGQWRWLALQIPPEESRARPIADASWDLLGLPESTWRDPAQTAARAALAQRTAKAAETESQQKLWRWSILLVLLLLAVESFAAIRLARNQEPITA